MIQKLNSKNKLKQFLIILFLLIIYVIISAFSYVTAISTNIENSVFRLHVIANSDSNEDQNLKYLVRDNIIEYIHTISQNASNKNDIILLVNQHLEEIKSIAQNTINQNGYNYTVNVEIGNFSFPTKNYGDITLPSGFYDALRIKIGKAEGKNWWCVMFPPLCFIDITSGVVPEESKELLKENMSSEEFALISDCNYNSNVKFKIVELIQNIGIKLAEI